MRGELLAPGQGKMILDSILASMTTNHLWMKIYTLAPTGQFGSALFVQQELAGKDEVIVQFLQVFAFQREFTATCARLHQLHIVAGTVIIKIIF